MSNTQNPAALAESFRDIFISEESGALSVVSSGEQIAIRFNRGLAVAVEVMTGAAGNGGSGVRKDSFLLAGARQEGGAADEDVAILVAPRGAKGEAGPVGIKEAARALVERAFAWRPDSTRFEPAHSSPDDLDGDMLETAGIFFSGVRAMSGFEPIHDALLALDHRLTIRPNPTVPLERLALAPIHGFLLSRLDGSLSLREITSTLGPEDEPEASRFVYALLLVGSVALVPPLGPGPFRTELLLSDHVRDAAREHSEVEFIHETYSSIQKQNPYEILGVAETAQVAEIQRAYEDRRLATAPDRFLEKVREKMRSELRIIEARLTEAYLALQAGRTLPAAGHSGGEGRLDFDTLALRREVSKTDVAADLAEQEKQAEQYYQAARKYFNQGDYHNCIEYSKLAIRQSDRTARYHFLLGEAQARNADHRWQKMAEKSFLEAARLDPWNAEYLVTLGLFYRKLGLLMRARRQFEKALELQPGHPRASDELAQMA